jgi:hypothetical protein
VDVLEDQQHRSVLADRGHEVGDRRMKSVALRIGVRRNECGQITEDRRQVRQDPREVATACPNRGAERFAGRPADERGQRLDDGAVRCLDDRVAGSVQDQGAVFGQPAGELPNEAALPRARLTRDERSPTPLTRGPWQQRVEAQ